ncbi:MAG TPA: non-canonical purine NTP pyrophosphatase [Candidatus Binataceae bacterium]|nr:non-canonical purine NTP pyrophosphatase [Candidatus Binataceae bacterium]
MKRLLIATSNPAKLAEYRLLLREFALESLSLADVGIREQPEEDGATFAENALKKARFYFRRSGLPTLADDGGLEVDALGGEPGVRSHRWLGAGASSDEALVAEVIRRMQGVEPSRRTARITAAVVLVYPDAGLPRECVAQASMEGVIAERAWPRIRPGFPYRSVLYLPDRECYVAELGDEEEARISQRRTALAQLAPDLRRVAENT